MPCLGVSFSCEVTVVERNLENAKPCTLQPQGLSKRLLCVRQHTGIMRTLIVTRLPCIHTYMVAHVHMGTQHEGGGCCNLVDRALLHSQVKCVHKQRIKPLGLLLS